MALIDSKELVKYAWSNPDVTVDGDGYISPFTVENFAEEHAMETAPVAFGRWKKRKDGTPYCSACGANERDSYDAVIEECRFCYRCGARML